MDNEKSEKGKKIGTHQVVFGYGFNEQFWGEHAWRETYGKFTYFKENMVKEKQEKLVNNVPKFYICL